MSADGAGLCSFEHTVSVVTTLNFPDNFLNVTASFFSGPQDPRFDFLPEAQPRPARARETVVRGDAGGVAPPRAGAPHAGRVLQRRKQSKSRRAMPGNHFYRNDLVTAYGACTLANLHPLYTSHKYAGENSNEPS